MVTTKAVCIEQIVSIWDDGLQTILIPLEQNVKLSEVEGGLWNIPLCTNVMGN
jgi:hypothetical protein